MTKQKQSQTGTNAKPQQPTKPRGRVRATNADQEAPKKGEAVDVKIVLPIIDSAQVIEVIKANDEGNAYLCKLSNGTSTWVSADKFPKDK